MDVFLRCTGVLLVLVLQKCLYIKDVSEKEPETDPGDALAQKLQPYGIVSHLENWGYI